ncbi:MAG: hypothetical protein GX238_01725 [Epulopiscium sp.]|nr:hypothetical protein [Candidatus Epulonipiscium sp.]
MDSLSSLFQENKKGYIQNGVAFSPCNTPIGNQLTVKYKGLLTQSGESEIYARIGYGNDSNVWNDIQDIPLISSQDQDMEITLPLVENQVLHMAFHNGLGYWDNNSGRDYHFKSRTRPQW